MTQNTCCKIIHYIKSLCIGLPFYGIFITAIALLNKETSFTWYFIAALVYLSLHFFLRESIEQSILFVALSLFITPIPLLFFPMLISKLLCLALSVVYLILSLRIRYTMHYFEQSDLSFVGTIPFVLLTLIAEHYHSYELVNHLFFLGLSYILLGFIILYFVGLLQYQRNNEHVASVPYRTLLPTNALTLLLFSVLSVFCMICTRYIPLGPIFNQIKNFFILLIKFILSFFSHTPTVEPTPMPSVEPVVSPSLDPLMVDDSYTPPFLQLISDVFYYAAKILAILFLIGVTLLGIYYLFTSLQKKNRQSNDKIESLSIFNKKETIIKQKKNGNVFQRLFIRTTNEKIRKHFHQEIRSNMEPSSMQTTMTPTELTSAITTDSTEETKQKLVELYEKARYSGKDCSTEDWEEMKQLSFRSSKEK